MPSICPLHSMRRRPYARSLRKLWQWLPHGKQPIMPNTSSSYPARSLSLSLVPSIQKPQSMNAQEKKLSCYGCSQSQQTTISQLIFTRHYLLTIHLHNKQASTTHLHTKPASTPHLHSKLASTARFYNKPASLFWRKCHRKALFFISTVGMVGSRITILFWLTYFAWSAWCSLSCAPAIIITIIHHPFHPLVELSRAPGLRRSIFSTPCCRSCAINLVLLSASLDAKNRNNQWSLYVILNIQFVNHCEYQDVASTW